jgi:putative endonuclease
MSEKPAIPGSAAPQRAVRKRTLEAAPCEPSTRREPRTACSPRKPTGRRTLQQRIGQRAEDIAADFLRTQGLEILERNYRRRLGELDIIARDGDVLVIVEVRSRASNRFGGAAASVDGRKQRRLVRATAQLLQQRRDFSHLRLRFDVISVSETAAISPRVEWFQHAFLT